MSHKGRAILLFTIVACFTVLIFGGAKINEHKPPIPERVVAASGEVVMTGEDIHQGQLQYLTRGGQQTGSIWGHGAYLAPDWSADALHRIGLVAAGLAAGRGAQAAAFTQAELEALPAGERGRVEAEVAHELRQNRYDRRDRHADALARPGGRVPGPRLLLHAALRRGLRRDVDPGRLRAGPRRRPAR